VSGVAMQMIIGVLIVVVLFKVALSLLEAEGYKDLKIST